LLNELPRFTTITFIVPAMITLCRVHQLTLINFYNRNTLIKASKPYSTLLDQSILCIFRRLFCIMVSGAGSSFPRITGFAFRFQTKLCPGCGCGRRQPNDRLWGCDPGPWRPMSFGDWNLSKHISASGVPSNKTPPVGTLRTLFIRTLQDWSNRS
jgi:hypothetical protein